MRLFLLLFIFANYNFAFSQLALLETNKSFIVEDVEVSAPIQDKSTAEEVLFIEAKRSAFDMLRKGNIVDRNFNASDREIEEMVSAFTPRDINNYKDMEYVGIFDVIFDKNAITEFLTKKRIDQEDILTGNNSFLAMVATYGRFSTWFKVKERLNKAGFRYSIVSITVDSIEILIKSSSQEELKQQIVNSNLKIINNSDVMFIKLPLFA